MLWCFGLHIKKLLKKELEVNSNISCGGTACYRENQCLVVVTLPIHLSETSILERIKTIPDEKLSSHGLNIKIKALKDIKTLSIEDFIYLCDDGALDKYRLYYGKAFPLVKKEKDKKILSALIMIVIIVCLLLYIEYQLNIFGIFKAYY